MNWHVMARTFGLVFVAELGDKTQLATLSLSAGGSRWAVFAGAALALVASSAIAVLGGDAISRVVPVIWMKRAAGALFIVMGVMFLLSRPDVASP